MVYSYYNCIVLASRLFRHVNTIFLHNFVVVGVCINNIDLGYNYIQSLVNAFGAGVGFLLAMLIFSGMRQKLENNPKIPKPFQGVPITMTTAALLSLAFMGFGGLV